MSELPPLGTAVCERDMPPLGVAVCESDMSELPPLGTAVCERDMPPLGVAVCERDMSELPPLGTAVFERDMPPLVEACLSHRLHAAPMSLSQTAVPSRGNSDMSLSQTATPSGGMQSVRETCLQWGRHAVCERDMPPVGAAVCERICVELTDAVDYRFQFTHRLIKSTATSRVTYETHLVTTNNIPSKDD